MKKSLVWGIAALALIGVSSSRAADIEFKPIDTKKYVVKPSQAVANLTAQTINIAGQSAAGSLEQNGYIKTINNLFSKKIKVPDTQLGPSRLPAPTMFPSTTYKSYNTPVMPTYQYRR